MMKLIKFLTGTLYYGAARAVRAEDTDSAFVSLAIITVAITPPLLLFLAIFGAGFWIGYPAVGIALGGISYFAWMMMLDDKLK